MLWNGSSVTTVAVVVLVPLAAGRCLAGEGFLNRDAKVNDAVLYGRTIGDTPYSVGGAAATPTEDDHAAASGPAATPAGDRPSGTPSAADVGAPR